MIEGWNSSERISIEIEIFQIGQMCDLDDVIGCNDRREQLSRSQACARWITCIEIEFIADEGQSDDLRRKFELCQIDPAFCIAIDHCGV